MLGLISYVTFNMTNTMPIYVIGINHQTAPLSVREQIVFHQDQLSSALQDIRRYTDEAVLISTCNRTEIYAVGDTHDEILAWLADYHRLSLDTLRRHSYMHLGREAVRHILRVSAGLDSMVLGEPQILGQLKSAVRTAHQVGIVGVHLHTLFQFVFAVAKEIRTTTQIGNNSVSMAAIAVKVAQRIFGDISAQRLLLIGAGDMIQLCAEHFNTHNPREIVVANRNLARAQTLLDLKLGHRALLLSDMPAQLASFDIVISSTASTLPIIGLGLVEDALKIRHHRPVLMIDLAVPRDIEQQVATLDDVFLYTVDDLGLLVANALENRQEAAADAETIVQQRVEDWLNRWQARRTVPTIKALRHWAESMRQKELQRAYRRLQLGDAPDKVLEHTSYVLMNQFLHAPSHALKTSQGEAREKIAELLRQLYSLHED